MKKYILSIATLCIIAIASFAQNGITPLSEPFYDGTAMYLYNVHAQKFYTGGNEWGTRASIGDEGLKVYLEKYLVDGVWDGKTVIFRDSVPIRDGIYDVFMGDNELGDVWVDRAGQPNYLWELTQSGSYYRFSMAAVCPDYESFYRPGTYLGWDSTLDEGNNSRLWAFMDPAISNHVDWVFMSEASYEAVPKRSVLQATIEQAKLFGIDVSAYELIANNSQATYDELGMAIENLQATINGFVIQQIQGATPSNPKDATSFIKNPQFTEDVTAWQGEPVWGADCAEKWNCNFDVYQDLTGLPNGYYKVSVQGFYRAGDGGSTSMDQHAFLYANEISIPLMNINAHAGNEVFEGGNVSDVEGLGIVPNDMATASTAFSAGLYADNTLTVLVTDGTLRIGIKKETLIAEDWTIFDNFELYYLGTELDTGIAPLTADMFKTWDSVGADASSTGAATAELHVGEELGGGATVYGDPSVYFLTFADLTGYDKIVFEGTPGVQLRVLMNRVEHEGALIEVNPTIGEDGKTEVDLTDYEFVHLNAIKIGWGSPVGTITAINLVKAAEHETPAGVVVVAADFEDGNVPFFSWNDNTRTVVDGVLEISIPETVDAWGQQMAYDNFFEYNAIYTMKFKVKGSAAGSISANFQVTTDAYKDAGNFGAIEFGTEWTEFESSVTVSQKAADRLIFNLSSFAGTVYMDDFVLTVRPEAGGPEVWTNILTNCDLEGEADFSFIAVSNDPNKFDSENGEYIRGIAEIIDGIGKDGSRGIKVKSFAGATENWDAQFWIVMPQVLPAGTKYRISFDYRASTDVTVETEAHANPTEYIHYDMLGSIAFTPEWQHYEKSGVISDAQASNADGLLFKSIAFDLAIDKENDVEFYFDNIIYEVLNFVPETPTTKVAYLCGATETTEAIYTALVNAGMDVTPLNYDDVYLTEEIVANDFVGKYDLVVLAGSTGSSTPLAQTANLLLGKVNVLSTKSFWYQHYGTKGTNPGTVDNPSLNLVKSIADHPIFAGIAGEEFAVFNDMAKATGRYLQGNGSFADGPEQITLATANGTDCIGEAWVNGKGYLIIPVDGAQPEGYLTADGEALYVNAANYLINGEQYGNLNELQELMGKVKEAEAAGLEALAKYPNYTDEAGLSITLQNLPKSTVGQTVESIQAAIDAVYAVIPLFEAENAPLVSGTYYMKNVGADKYLMAANAWGSQASFGEHGLDVLITLANGKYTIDTNVSNGGDNHFLGENGYVDSPVTEWTFIKQSNGTFAITTDGTNFIGYDGGSSIMSLSLTDATSPNAQWQFVTKEELVEALSTASSGNPVDATFFIQGPNFGRNDLRNTAWQGSPAYSGEVGNSCAEKFDCNFDVYQDLTGLPNGYYKVSMQGFYRAGNGGSTSMEQHAYFYAGEVSIPLMNINAHAGNEAFEGGNVSDVEDLGFVPNNMAAASTAFSAGLYADNTLTVLVTDGTLRIGIKKETLIENDWTIFDNFELYYLGTECEMETVPLTADMFKTWDSVGADASSTGAATAELHVGEELGGGATVYGDPSVYFLTFADLTGYDKIVFEGTPGIQLRVLMNRVEHEGALIEVNPTIGEDGKTEVDLTDYEFVHLNAIKIGWGSPVGTITAINLVKDAEPEGGVVRVSLQDVEFYSYDGWGPDAKKLDLATPEWIMNAPSSCPYGDTSVNNGADLSAYSKMFVTVSPESEGMRIMMNRKIQEGQCDDTEEASNLISIPSHAWCTQKYCKQEGLTYIIDLAQILKDQGFVRLHAIKGASWDSQATIESIELERATSSDITLDEKKELLSINFDDGVNPMMGWGNNSTNEVVDGVLKITNPSAVNSWEAQIAYDFEMPFLPDCEYTLTMRVRGSAPGQISIGLQNEDDNYASVGEFGTVDFDADWKDVEMTCLCNGEGGKRLVFSFGQFEGDIYIDDLKLLFEAKSSTQISKYNDAQGIHYQLNEQNTFTVTGYDETLNSDIAILENIEGKPVTQIKAGAFKNAYALKSVTIPSSITNVGVSAFSGCHNLLVVKWNAVAPLNADCFDNPEEYGNMLVFVTNANLTRNYKGNVVVNGVAENIQLIDGRPFRNPQEFTAKKISYTRHFTKKSKVGAPAGWEGMILPFDVQTVTSETKGLLAPFEKSNLTSTRPFWMARWQTSSEWFTRSTVFAANEPFIIAMPNSDEYDESFNIEGDVIFYSLNTKVHTTDLQSEDGNFSLNGCYESVPSSSQIYALNDEEYTAPRGGGVFMPGGAFVANSRDIRPFEAYIYNAQLATTRRYIPVQGGGITTSIDRIMLKEGKQCVDVYTLQGIMVKHQIPVEDLEKDLPKGIYVVDGKKFVVK